MKDSVGESAQPIGMVQRHSDSNYFMRRASEEQVAAQRARDPRARQSHSDLADRYEQAALFGDLEPSDAEPTHEPHTVVPLFQPDFRILP
ncbi:MAG TPA: hypothetical protein VGB39_04160 [Sphingomicrobium sp.]